MDRIYRLQRHFYDLTRKYYLLGRDRVIERMRVEPSDHILEVGCGTARNLIKLARKHPQAKFYGLDASEEMLKTAQNRIDAAGLTGRIILRHCLAEQLDHQATFGHDRPFDALFFSYALSMIPTWKDSTDVAIRNTKVGGEIWIVDFWDQAELPAWFAVLLKRWLRLFHVEHRPELLAYIEQVAREGKVSLDLQSIRRRYAYIAKLVRL